MTVFFLQSRRISSRLLSSCKGADVNAVARNGTGFTYLTGVVSRMHKVIAELLLSKGANVNHRYEAGFSPLMIAAENEH